MIKRTKVVVSVILIWVALLITDFSLAKLNKAPVFSIPIVYHKDGGSTEYYGLGYKIIKYVNLTVQEGPKIVKHDFGTWFMEFSSRE